MHEYKKQICSAHITIHILMIHLIFKSKDTENKKRNPVEQSLSSVSLSTSAVNKKMWHAHHRNLKRFQGTDTY
jgi:hypothetical protein